MTDFTISLAGIPVGIRARYSSTRTFCEDYLTEEAPAFTVTSSEEIIQREQERSDRQAAFEVAPKEVYDRPYLEQLGIYREIAERLLDQGVLLFHGSALAVDGQAYLFTARSGTGKSTHARLWRQMLGERVVMINDDKPVLKISESGVSVCGTPWNGKHRLGGPVIRPLRALCVLERAERNRIEPLNSWEAFPLLLQQSYRPLDRMKIPRMLELLDTMMEHTAMYKMYCNNLQEDAARVSFEEMSKGDK